MFDQPTMNKSGYLFPLCIVIFLAIFLVAGIVILDYRRQVIMFPLLIGIPTCLLCLVLVFCKGNEPNLSADKGNHAGHLKKDIYNLLWLAAILPIIYILGPFMGIFFYLVMWLTLRGEKWYIAVALGLATILIINSIFLKILNLSLPVGLLGF